MDLPHHRRSLPFIRLVCIDRPCPSSIYVHSYTENACTCIATPLVSTFNSSLVIAQKAEYLGNGTGNRSQTWKQVSSKGVLLINIAIVIFARNSIRRVFPDVITYMMPFAQLVYSIQQLIFTKFAQLNCDNIVLHFAKQIKACLDVLHHPSKNNILWLSALQHSCKSYR